MAPQETGAHAANEKKGGGLLWLWLLLGAIALALIVWLIAELVDDGDELEETLPVATEEVTEDATEEATVAAPPATVEETTTSTSTATETTTVPPPAPAPAPGVVLVGDVDVLTAAPEDLSALVGQQVTAESVQVVEVVADEAFYVGPEVGSTVLVRLEEFAGDDAPESPFQVEEGDTVSLTGTLEQLDEALVSSLTLYDPAEELELGEYYVQVDEISGVS